MLKAAAAVVVVVILAGCSTKSNSTSAAPPSTQPTLSGPATTAGSVGQGVTATTIKLGITYVDLAAIRSIVNIDHGDYQKAYTAVIDDVNAHGGINGRTIVPVFAPVSPIGTDPAAAACTKLTEDDKVFAVVGFFQSDDPLCYVGTHDTPVIGASLTAEQQQRAKATWFNVTLSDDHLVPKLIDALANQGVFSGHKVAVVGLAGDQAAVQNLAVPELKKLNVNVVQTAINDAPLSDTQAGYQQFSLIAAKFSAVGADVVVAVGNAGDAWPKALQVNHSTYHPRLVATSYNALSLYVADKAGADPQVLKDAITGASIPPTAVSWNDPAMQHCVALVQAAEPGATINNPVTASPTTPNTWVSPTAACQLVTLFADVAKAAGATLNNATFLSGGESLTGVTIPGAGAVLHFGPAAHDGNGPIYISHWNPADKKLDTDSSAS